MWFASMRALTIVLICSTVFPSHAESAPGQGQVEDFHAALIATARLDQGFDARAELLGGVFDQVFDLKRIARISAGKAWRSLDEPTKTAYVGLLRDVLISTYVSRFDADRGQRFEILEAKSVAPGRDLVRSKIVRPTGASVLLAYYLRDNRVFNVEADGVSDLSIRRAEYAALIESEGFPALLDHLRKQATAARAEFSAARD